MCNSIDKGQAWGILVCVDQQAKRYYKRASDQVFIGMNLSSELIWQDTQHQMLFKLIAQLKQEPFDSNILVHLQQYADQHFCLEEAYMIELKYPKTEAHIQAHNRFREELHQLAQMPSSIGSSERESLSLFLEEWLTRHIFGIDKEFEQFVLDSKRK